MSSFLENVSSLANVLEDTLDTLRLYGSPNVPSLKQLVPEDLLKTTGLSIADIKSILDTYISRNQLDYNVDISDKDPRVSKDPLRRQMALFPNVRREWKTRVYTAKRTAVDRALRDAEERIKRAVDSELQTVADKLRPSLEYDDLRNLETTMTIDTAVLTPGLRALRNRLYGAEGLKYHDDPELFYSLCFQAVVRNQGVDQKKDEEILSFLGEQCIPQDLYEGVMGRQLQDGRKRTASLIPSNLAALIAHGRDFNANTTLQALDNARTTIGVDSIIATIPELAQIRIKSPKESRFWTQWYTGLSELDIGTSPQGNPVAVIAHLGILSVPGRLKRAYDNKQNWVNGAAPYSDLEFQRLLDGTLPDGSPIPVFDFAEFLRNGSQNLPRRYAVVMDLKEAQKYPSGVHNTGAFLDHPLFTSAVGGKEELAQYLRRVVEVRGKDETFCTKHLTTTGSEKAHGRLLFLYSNGHGLGGDDSLNSNGRFLVGSSGGAA